jgi:hypothetical protein
MRFNRGSAREPDEGWPARTVTRSDRDAAIESGRTANSEAGGRHVPAVDTGGEAMAETEDPIELVTDYDKLGTFVSTVLESAKEAAEKIRQAARDDARRLRERTEREASAKRAEAEQRAEELTTAASQVRDKAEKESRLIHERANSLLQEKRQASEAEAAAILARAERDALEHTRAAEERRSKLAKNVEMSEERLRELVTGLRELATRLEDLVEQPAGKGRATVREGETLEESLRPSRNDVRISGE